MRAPVPDNSAAVRNREVVCAAPAKINLALHVTGQRPDGYHTLETLAVFCDIGDQVLVATDPDKPVGTIDLRSSGPFAQNLPAAQSNIVTRAAQAFQPFLNAPEGGIKITIEKNLPIASGIGGGSADAAATLLALKELAGNRDGNAPESLAETIGSDVPMCLHSRPLMARGRGEAIELIDDFPELFLVLVNPGVAVSTSRIFAALQNRSNPALAALPDPLTPDALLTWLKDQRNDLQAPAKTFAPVISDALQTIEAAGAGFVRMSGSGATCFGIFSDIKHAEDAALQIRQIHPDWWVVATKTQYHGNDRVKAVDGRKKR